MNPQIKGLEALLWGQFLLLIAAILGVLVWRAQLRAATGAPRRSSTPGRRARLLSVAVVALVAIFVVAVDVPIRPLPALAVLGSAAVLLAVVPGQRDAILGGSGVQFGWHARRFADLEEWRLTGDHLRWKLFGEWVATDAPADLHAELRTQLSAVNPDRESRFQR